MDRLGRWICTVHLISAPHQPGRKQMCHNRNLKNDNLQYNTLVCWFDGTNESSNFFHYSNIFWKMRHLVNETVVPSSQRTEVRFASFISGGFTTMSVINLPESKLAKRTSVPCVDIFNGINVDKKWIFLDHLPTSS